MADDLNSLLQANRSSSVLQGIANPAQINPLAAVNSATTAARNTFDLREKQAQQAVGDILQQATGPDGTIDYPKAQSLAAQAGPVVQMGMSAFLKDASGLKGAQMSQGGARNTAVGNAIVGALNGDDAGLHTRVASGLQGLIANGVMTPEEATKWALTMPNDPAQIRQRLEQLRISLMPSDQQQGNIYGTRQVINTPQGTYVTTVPPISGGQGVTVPHGPTPGSTTTVSEPYDDQGIIPRDANGAPTRPPKGYTSVTKPVTAVPGVPAGGPPVLTPGATPPGVPAPGTVPVTPAPGVTPGRVTPTNPALLPNKPGAVVPAPAVATPAPAVQPPAITAPPQGQPQKVEADVKAYTEDQAARPAAMNSAQNLSHAYEALAMLKSNTGKGAQGINTLRSWAQTLGIAPAGAIEEQKLIELVTKYTEREMISAAGGSTTDMGRRMQEQANAGTLLSTPANFDIMRNDLGTKMQGIAANQAHASKDGVGYVEHRAKIASTTDPRGFVWNLYSPEEQARILKEVEKDPTAADHLHRAIGMVDKLQLRIPGSSPKPPPATPGKQSFLAPPAPMANALIPA